MCGGSKATESAAPAPAPAPAPRTAPKKRPSSNEQPPPKKRNAFDLLKRESMSRQQYTLGEFRARILSRGSGLPAGVRVRTFVVDGLFLLEDMLTPSEATNLRLFVEPLLRAGNHIDSGPGVHSHVHFGARNQGGYPCALNRRASRAWAGTEFEDTHRPVPNTGPEPPATAPPPIPARPLRALTRQVSALRVPGEKGKALVPQASDALLYEPGGQIGPHADDPYSGPTVCLYTLGSPATMTFTWKGKAKKGRYGDLDPVRVHLPRRSLLVFTDDARHYFDHSIDAADIAYSELGHRISITFRATTMPDEWSKWRCQPGGSCSVANPCALCNPPLL